MKMLHYQITSGHMSVSQKYRGTHETHYLKLPWKWWILWETRGDPMLFSPWVNFFARVWFPVHLYCIMLWYIQYHAFELGSNTPCKSSSELWVFRFIKVQSANLVFQGPVFRRLHRCFWSSWLAVMNFMASWITGSCGGWSKFRWRKPLVWLVWTNKKVSFRKGRASRVELNLIH